MNSVLPVALFAFGGVLVGGAYTMHAQGAGRLPVVVLGAFAMLSLVAGGLWLAEGS